MFRLEGGGEIISYAFSLASIHSSGNCAEMMLSYFYCNLSSLAYYFTLNFNLIIAH